MQAAAELALRQQCSDLGEQELQLLRADAEQVEVAHAGRVEHVAAAGQRQQFGVRGGVATLADVVEVAGAQHDAGHHGVQQRRLASPAEPDQHAAVRMQQGAEFGQRGLGTMAFRTARRQHAHAARRVDRLPLRGGLRIEIALGEHQHGGDLLARGRGEQAVDEFGLERRLAHAGHGQQQRHVGGEHLGAFFAFGGGAAVQLRGARQDHRDRLAGGVEFDPVADREWTLLVRLRLEQLARERQLQDLARYLDVADLGVDA